MRNVTSTPENIFCRSTLICVEDVNFPVQALIYSGAEQSLISLNIVQQFKLSHLTELNLLFLSTNLSTSQVSQARLSPSFIIRLLIYIWQSSYKIMLQKTYFPCWSIAYQQVFPKPPVLDPLLPILNVVYLYLSLDPATSFVTHLQLLRCHRTTCPATILYAPPTFSDTGPYLPGNLYSPLNAATRQPSCIN